VTTVLVDSNVILDVITVDPVWGAWSEEQLECLADEHVLAINPLIYAEIAVGFERIEDLDQALPRELFRREPLPFESAFLAGQCFALYRRRGGARTTTLPDFYIGAHAAIAGWTLLTRDHRRYRSYFPSLSIIAPPSPVRRAP
jgi:predicted nucleic acid-binding protein